MNQNMMLERMLETYMADAAAGPAPEGLVDNVLSATIHTGPDPRWLALLKEPPMRAQSQVVAGMPGRRLVLTMAAAALILLATAAAIIGSNLIKPPQQPAGDDWPMFRGDAARNGISLRGPSGHPVIGWQFHASGAISHSVSIVGDTVYAASDDGVIHAVALDGGAERWHVALAQGITSDPVIAGDALFIGDATGTVRRLDRSTGTEIWRTAQFTGPLTMGGNDSVVLVGSGDGLLVAFDPSTGAERWRATLSPSGGTVSSAGIADGVVYAGTARNGTHALEAATGRPLWHVETSESTGTAVVANGYVYVGMSSEDQTGHLRALDARTGRVAWEIDEPFQSPAVANGVLYTGSSTGFIAAVDPSSGAIKWRTRIRSPLHPLAVVGGVVYAPSDQEHRVLALDAATGGQLWTLPVDGPIQCCVAVAKGSLFVGTNAGTLYSIGGDGAALAAASVQPVASSTPATPAPTPTATATAALAQIKVAWTATPPDHRYNANGSIDIDPAGNIWVPDHVNDRFTILSPAGKVVGHWGKSGSGDGEFILDRPNGDGYGGIAFAPDGSFFVLDTGNRRVEKFTAKREFVKSWGGFGSGATQYSDPVAIQVGPDRNVYVLDDVRSVLEKYDLDGNVLGSFDPFSNGPSNAGSNGFTVDRDGNFYVGQVQPNQVAVFDPNGKLVRTLGVGDDFVFAEQPGQIAVDAKGRVFVTQGPQRSAAPGVVVFDRDGRYVAGFGPRQGSDPDLHFPTGILFDGSGALILQDAGPIEVGTNDQGRIMKIQLLPPLAP
jgi:outer membrane protein assembly factor BamB